MEKAVTTILLIEDDPIHAKLIKKDLHGFDNSMIIEHVTNTTEGLAYIEKSANYDLIVLNYDLPNKNGLEALRAIRKTHNFKKPVIMLLSQKHETLAVEALREGATNCLIKTEDFTSVLPMVITNTLKDRAKSPETVVYEFRPKEDLIQFTMNGQTVIGQKDETILDVARRYGIHIPTLCYHPSASRFGACRICLVEVTAGKVTRLFPSCMYPIQAGIIVNTNTEKVLTTRRMIIELLLARCPEAEVINDMASGLGVDRTRLKLRENPDKCILCGLCVRVCEEVIGVSAISFTHRGIHRNVGTPFMELSDACTGCAECAKVCPTKAITLEHIDQKIRKRQKTRVAVKCDGCTGHSTRACVNNCPTGALKVLSIADFLSKNKGSINVELRDLLKYSLEEAEGQNARNNRS